MCVGAVHRHLPSLLFDSATSQSTLTLSVCFTVPVCCVNSSTLSRHAPLTLGSTVKDYGAPRSVYAASSSVCCTRLRRHSQSLMTGIPRVTLKGQCAPHRVSTCHSVRDNADHLNLLPPPHAPRHPMCDSRKRKPEEKEK